MSEISRIERRLSTAESSIQRIQAEMDRVRRRNNSSGTRSPIRQGGMNQMREPKTRLGAAVKKGVEALRTVRGQIGFQVATQLGGQLISGAANTFFNDSTIQNKFNNISGLANKGNMLVSAGLAGGPVGLIAAAAALAIDFAFKAYELGMKMESRFNQSQKDQERLGVIVNGMGRK